MFDSRFFFSAPRGEWQPTTKNLEHAAPRSSLLSPQYVSGSPFPLGALVSTRDKKVGPVVLGVERERRREEGGGGGTLVVCAAADGNVLVCWTGHPYLLPTAPRNRAVHAAVSTKCDRERAFNIADDQLHVQTQAHTAEHVAAEYHTHDAWFGT